MVIVFEKSKVYRNVERFKPVTSRSLCIDTNRYKEAYQLKQPINLQ